MTSAANAVDAPATPQVCRRIRSKGAGVVYGEQVRWDSGFHPNAVYWCVATAEPIGPDDGLVHPHACTIGRVCFQAPAVQV